MAVGVTGTVMVIVETAPEGPHALQVLAVVIIGIVAAVALEKGQEYI